MSVIDLSKISDKQYRFLSDTHMHVAYGGARGGGKSWAVRTKAKILAVKYKGIKILIVRRTFPELVNNHINTLRAELFDVAVYNKTEKEFTFKNGSTIKFGYCNKDKDLDQYQGAEFDVIFLDEATQLQELWIKKIVACVRGVNDFPKRIYYTCNPGGPGHSYIKRLFIDRNFEAGERPEDYTFIQALVQDNKALMESQPEYIKQLEILPPKLKKAWLDGSWNIFEGQFFEDFIDDPDHYADRQFTHVIDPFEIPGGWKIYRSFDWGYNQPFSCAWWAVDYDGVIYRILEYYGWNGTPNEGIKWNPHQVFAKIQEVEREHPWLAGKRIHGIADPSIWDAQSGESTAAVAAKYQIYFTPGDNKRIPGWMQMHYRFAFDQNGFPQMYIFSNCKAFIRTIPLLQYDEHKPEDLNTKGEDHAADEARYFCMSRPIKPILPQEPDPWQQHPANLFLDVDRKNLSTAARRPRMEIIDEDW